jgi:TP901 family phage tail tape measure protein
MVVKMGGLESSLKFAAAAGMDLNAAAELSIKNLGTFVPITASAAEQTQFLATSQDLLVKAAGASTLDVDALGAAMLGAGGQAKAAGVDYKDFVTTMGMISPSFDSAATAGTSYKNFLARLQPTTKSAMSAMMELNLVTADGKSKFYDSSGAFIGNRAAAELLNKSLNGLSAAQRMSTLQAIFGNDAMGAAVALANSGAAGYDKFAAAMASASGVEQTAATVQQGFNIALDNFHGSIEALQIVVGSMLLPVLTFFLNSVISPGINLVTGFTQAMLGSSDAMAGLPGVLQIVVSFFGDLWTATATVIAALRGSGDAIAQLSQPMQLFMAVLGNVWAAFDQGGGVIVDFINGAADLNQVAAVMTSIFGADLGGAITSAVGYIDQAAAAFQNWMATLYQAGATIYDFATGATGLIGLTTTLAQLFGPTLGKLIAEAVSVLNNYTTI